jgi:hypothetical protein
MRSTHEVGGATEGEDTVSTTGFGGMGVPDGIDSLRDPKDTSGMHGWGRIRPCTLSKDPLFREPLHIDAARRDREARVRQRVGTEESFIDIVKHHVRLSFLSSTTYTTTLVRNVGKDLYSAKQKKREYRYVM